MASRRLGEHICCLYETDQELAETVAPFIAAGLAADERCSVVGAASTLRIISEHLAMAGVPTCESKRTRRLIMTQDIRDCPFSSAAASLIDARDAKFSGDRSFWVEKSGFRCVFAVTDFLCHADERALLLREINLNLLLRSRPGIMLLMYDKRHLNDTVVADMLEIHPKVINGGAVYENPAYVLPEELL